MDIYQEKKAIKVIILSTLAKILIFLAIISAGIFAAQYFKVFNQLNQFQNLIRIGAIAFFVVAVLLLILSAVVNKRKNVRFDGRIIKFCVNNYVEHEFDLRRVDELFNFRDSATITYGLQDAMAFRFHKNETWETIDSKLLEKKSKKSSIALIRDINVAYALIKSKRALAEMSDTKGVRFRYLTPEKGEQVDVDLRNAQLKIFEGLFQGYSNTYGNLHVDRLVITKNSLLYNKRVIATNGGGFYVDVMPVYVGINDDYIKSDIVNFYNAEDELVLEVDLTLVINGELFKTLALAVFDDKERRNIIKENASSRIVEEKEAVVAVEKKATPSIILDETNETVLEYEAPEETIEINGLLNGPEDIEDNET